MAPSAFTQPSKSQASRVLELNKYTAIGLSSTSWHSRMFCNSLLLLLLLGISSGGSENSYRLRRRRRRRIVEFITCRNLGLEIYSTDALRTTRGAKNRALESLYPVLEFEFQLSHGDKLCLTTTQEVQLLVPKE